MLSDRLRPSVEAAQWVIDEVKELEAENGRLRAENEQITSNAVELISSAYCKDHQREVKGATFHEFRIKETNAGCIFCLQSDLAEAVTEKENLRFGIEYAAQMASDRENIQKYLWDLIQKPETKEQKEGEE